MRGLVTTHAPPMRTARRDRVVFLCTDRTKSAGSHEGDPPRGMLTPVEAPSPSSIRLILPRRADPGEEFAGWHLLLTGSFQIQCHLKCAVGRVAQEPRRRIA